MPSYSKSQIPSQHVNEYRCTVPLNLYDSPTSRSLATQAAAGRHLRVLSQSEEDVLEVCLCEDDYPGWLPGEEFSHLEPVDTPYVAIALSPEEIQNRLPQVITFTLEAMKQPNYYLWGGTVAPNYDCSGLMQAAFMASGIWLPRDSYQQQAFTQAIAIEELIPGDLIFFGTSEKVNHVALYVGDGCYVHSSGKETGRNGIAIDPLSEQGDAITKAYYQQLHSYGRVITSYQPTKVQGLID